MEETNCPNYKQKGEPILFNFNSEEQIGHFQDGPVTVTEV